MMQDRFSLLRAVSPQSIIRNYNPQFWLMLCSLHRCPAQSAARDDDPSDRIFIGGLSRSVALDREIACRLQRIGYVEGKNLAMEARLPRAKSIGSTCSLPNWSVSSLMPMAGESVISKVPDSAGKFCLLKFPAIKEEPLYWDRPVLKDPSQGDIIDFYGPCSHDPLGNEEIRRQRDDYERRQRRLPESEGA